MWLFLYPLSLGSWSLPVRIAWAWLRTSILHPSGQRTKAKGSGGRRTRASTISVVLQTPKARASYIISWHSKRERERERGNHGGGRAAGQRDLLQELPRRPGSGPRALADVGDAVLAVLRVGRDIRLFGAALLGGKRWAVGLRRQRQRPVAAHPQLPPRQA